MVHGVGICSHSLISQYLPMRFHTSAAGRFTSISRGMEVYVGFATAGPEADGAGCAAGAGVCAAMPALRPTTTTIQAADLVLSRLLIEFLQNRNEPRSGEM